MIFGIDDALIGGLITGASGLASTLFSGNGAAAQQALARDQIQQGENQQQYQKALNALMLQRAQSGYRGPNGESIAFDPVTNTWKTQASDAQNAATGSFLSGTTQANAQTINTNDMLSRVLRDRISQVQPLIDQSINEYRNYRNVTPTDLRGALIQQVADANQRATRPIVQDTLRTFTRTGANPGSALAEIGRSSYDNLKSGMTDALLKSYTGSTEINNSNRNGMLDRTSKLTSMGSGVAPGYNLGSYDTSNLLGTMVGNMRNGMASAGNSATYGNVASGNATDQGYRNAILSAPNGNLGAAKISSIGDSANALLKAVSGFFPGSSDKTKQIDYSQGWDF